MGAGKIRRRLKWILLVIFTAEVVLVLSGSLPPEAAVMIVGITEGTALVLTLSVAVPGVASIAKRVSSRKVPVTTAAREVFEDAVPSPVLRLLEGELGIMSAIVRAAAGRRDCPEGSVPIGYGRSFRTLGFVLMAIAPIELVLVDLLCVHLAPSHFLLRIIVVAISVYAFVWIIGLVLATKVYPHYLLKDRAVFRYCNYKRVEVPLAEIESVDVVNRACGKSKMLYTEEGSLCLNNGMNTSNLLISFKRGISPLVNGKPWPEDVSSLALSVDDQEMARELIQSSLIFEGAADRQ